MTRKEEKKNAKEIKKAMKKIQTACFNRDSWTSCHTCPFDTFCTALIEAGLFDPFEGVNWNYCEKDE